jgi:hypothetical protein
MALNSSLMASTGDLTILTTNVLVPILCAISYDLPQPATPENGVACSNNSSILFIGNHGYAKLNIFIKIELLDIFKGHTTAYPAINLP